MAGSGGVELVHLLAQIAIVGIVEHGEASSSRGCKCPAFMTACFCELGSAIDSLLRET